MKHSFARLLVVFCLFAASIAIAQTPPVPWSGTRDKSCEVYHSAKYKTPIYSAEAINKHLIHVLAVDNSPKVFYRWEQPVRYYLEVPPEYPEIAKMFEEQVAQIAKYTRLDIARHDKFYTKYKDEKLNDRSKWPEGKPTNALIVFTADYVQTLKTPLVSFWLESFGHTIKQELADRQYIKDLNKNLKRPLDFYANLKYSYDPDGLKFVFHVLEPDFRDYGVAPLKSKKFIGTALSNAMRVATILHKDSKHVPSILQEDSYNLTDFDKQFLRVLYGKHIHSGIQVLKAKRLMYEELIDCFNAKPTSTKR
jgi:hypothetical protein